MNRSVSCAAVLVIAIGSIGPGAASAQQLPDAVKAGATVAITDDGGMVTQGRVDSLSGDVIRIKRRGQLDEVSVSRIVRIERPDTLHNGAVNGLIVGGTMSLMTIMSNRDLRKHPGIVLWMTASNSLLCGAVGTAIDGMIRGKRTLYERGRRRETSLAPIVAPSVGGAAVRVSW
jgi:hypothetical protein